MQALVKANWDQLSDIEYKFQAELSPVSNPTLRDITEMTIRWNRATNWEHREFNRANNWEYRESPSRKSSFPKPDHFGEQGWDGKLAQYFDAEQLDAGESHTSPQPQGFSGDEPLDFLAIRGYDMTGDMTIGSNLGGKDVLIEGGDSIDGHQVVVVNANLDPSRPRPDSMFVRYWLDPAAGGMPRRVELWLRGKLVRTSSNVKIEQVSHGFYFPVSFGVKLFQGGNDPVFKDGATIHFVVDPKSVKLNPGFRQSDYAVARAGLNQ